jgi:hypothetical protein
VLARRKGASAVLVVVVGVPVVRGDEKGGFEKRSETEIINYYFRHITTSTNPFCGDAT